MIRVRRNANMGSGVARRADGSTAVLLTNDAGDEQEVVFTAGADPDAVATELVLGFNNLHYHDLAVAGRARHDDDATFELTGKEAKQLLAIAEARGLPPKECLLQLLRELEEYLKKTKEPS